MDRCNREARESGKRQFYVYTNGAKRRGIAFSLSFEAFESIRRGGPCYWCGRSTAPSFGLDRIDNAVGYDEWNAVPCCRACNGAKSNRGAEDFLLMCFEVTKRHIDVQVVDRAGSLYRVVRAAAGQSDAGT